MNTPTALWVVVMYWFESKAGQNISLKLSYVKLVKSCVECCCADVYYDSKITVIRIVSVIFVA